MTTRKFILDLIGMLGLAVLLIGISALGQCRAAQAQDAWIKVEKGR
jgi:hypothetical protein